MSTSVPRLPIPHPTLRPFIVGAPISAGNCGQNWNSDLLWLLGTCVQPVANFLFPTSSAASFEIVVPYRRPPWIGAVGIEVELWGSLAAGVGGYAEVTASLPGAGMINPIGDLTGERSRLPYLNDRIVRPLRGIMDVTGVTANTNTALTISYAGTTPDPMGLPLFGVSRVSLFELPIASVNLLVDDTGPGVEGSWPVATGDARNALYEGTATGPSGFKRFVGELDRARTRSRWTQWAAVQEDDAAWFTDSSTLADLDWRIGDGSTQTVHLYTIAQQLYGPGVPDPHEVTIWYKTSDAGEDGEIELTADSGTTSFSLSVTLPGSTSWTSVTAGSLLALPTDHANQRVVITAQARISGGAELRISNICLRAAPP